MVGDMKLREGYKKTEVGIVPEDWEVVSLNEITSSINDGTHYTPKYVEQGVPFYSVESVTNNDFINTKFISKEEHNVLIRRCKPEKGDILLTRIGTLGQTKLIDWNVDASIYVSLGLIKINDKINERYLYCYTKSNMFVQDLEKRSLLNAIPKKINMDQIGYILIPKPPIKEQKAIAKALTDTENLIHSIQNLINKKEKIKKGTMQELLTGKKRLDGFSGEWGNKSLYELVEFINGKAHENFISDIGKYIVVNSRFVSTEGNVIKYSNQGNCLALTNDILMVMSDVPNGRAIAKCYYVEEDNRYTINQRVCILRSKDIISKFLFYVVDRNSHYLSFDDGVKQTNLKRDDVLNLNIKVPPLNEQKAISQAISDMDQEIQVLTRKLEKYKTIKQGMMQELLTGRIRLI